MLDNQKLNIKLREVLDRLDENLEKFERIEQSIIDEDSKQIIMQLMHKNREYAQQLLSNLLPDGRPCRMLKKYGGDRGEVAAVHHMISTEEFVDRCRKEESAFEKTYREVLNTANLQDGLKQMMQLQLNELKTLFLKVRINYMIKSRLISPYTLRKVYV